MKHREPEVILKRDREDPRLAQLAILSRLMDRAFRVPGTNWRFGLDAVLGLFPGLGDVVGSFVGAYAIWIARQLGAPAAIQLRMAMNLAIDGLIGIVPLAGDLFDFAFKAHTRNQALLAQWLTTPRTTHRSSVLVVAVTSLVLLGVLAGGAWLFARAASWLIAQF